MRADYESLIFTYESYTQDIAEILMDVAMEADETSGSTAAEPAEVDASSAVRDTVKSDETKSVQRTNLVRKISEKVKALIKKVGEIFISLKRKLENRLRLMMQTDKGFYTLYYKRKSMIKPYQNVKVVSYQYVNQVLDQPMDKLMKEIVMCLEKLRTIEGTSNTNARVSAILEAPQGKMIQTLLEPYTKNADGEVTSIPEFVKYLVERYRGEKKEFVYRDSQLPQIEANALSTKDIASKCNGYLRGAQDAYNKIKALEYQISRNSTNEKVLNLVAQNASKAATLYNAYSALIHSYYELKLEQSLNYRIILRKFYQF